MLYASGIGPFSSDRSRQMAREALEGIDVITLRDENSLAELKALGIDVSGAKITADPAFRIEVQAGNWIKYVMNRDGIVGTGKYFAVSVRGGATGISDDELDKLAFACKFIKEKYALKPLVVVLQPLLDDDVSKKLAGQLKAPIVSGLCATELTGLMAHMEFAVSMRLHLLIYAADAGIPIAALSHDPKLDALCDTLGVSDCLVSMDDGFTTDRVLKVMTHLCDDRDAVSAAVSARVVELRRLAASDAEYAVELLR